ncbi:protein HESO1 isoform X1 [Cryptomeria japonica]|uniref:protein HESO1 isoform X1 n=2 Tax=Cryptomeria japonica TaxID=3369 RepID=UPI0027DA2C82|nr:protein HESO1 isoform X1 [Cryptomeria japonica]XP_057836072.2 protein HESO1 isoform X1 [Cryptomeria japonica]
MDLSLNSTSQTQEDVSLATYAIRQRAEQLELEEAKKFGIIPKKLLSLGNLLDEVYSMLLPSWEDYEARKSLIAFVDKFANQNIRGGSYNHTGVSARAFGSYTMDLFTSGSDLDLSVNLGYNGVAFPRENKVKVLRTLSKAFHQLQGRGMVYGVLPVLRAIVPVLKFVDCRSGIECDISIENKDGILKSEMLRMFSSIDDRFQKLCYLMKAWAKAHNINSSRDRTLNSLSIILLVALHLQTRSPPILPAFSLFLKDEADISVVEKRVLQYINFGIHNKESIPELFISLLYKLLAVESLWQEGLCASTYVGNWIFKKLENKISCISVEDFTDRNQNAARSVKKEECETIYNCIRQTLSHLHQHLKGHSEASDLKEFLFGKALDKSYEAKHQHKGKRSMPFGDKVDQKKMRFAEDEQRDGNAVHHVPGFVADSMSGYGHLKEQAWGPRSSQWQESQPWLRHPPLPDSRQGFWHGQGHVPRFGLGHGLPHELPHLDPLEARLLDCQKSHLTLLEARFVDPFQNGIIHKLPPMIPSESRFPNLVQNGQAHQMSRLTHLEERFVNPFQNGREYLFPNNHNLNYLHRR